MKKATIILFALLLTVPVLGQTPSFDIEVRLPFVEPVSPGDPIYISVSGNTPHSLHEFSDAWFRFYHEGFLLEERHIDFADQHFECSFDTAYYVEGYATLDVGPWTWADEVELVIATSLFPNQYHWMSRNSLEVNPTTERVPSTSTCGVIVMLLLIPAISFWKR